LIVEGAVVTGDVTLGRGVNVWYYAVLRGDWGPIEVGENTNIQDHCLLHEGTVVGRGCTVGHGAILHGCTVGDNTLVGMGAVVLNGARIGNGCIVGAGALVTGKLDAPDGSMVLGSPARVVRPLTPSEIESNRAEARAYLAAAENYRQS
jgi:carbonic anhydrase/acetyltransferase-like protein (isoleucine patch superfamily)